MAFVEDFTPYLADFGQDVVLGGATTRAIFDNAYERAFDGIATKQPMLQLPSAAAAAVTQASTAVVGGVTYRVRDIQPDGTGWTLLLLERQ